MFDSLPYLVLGATCCLGALGAAVGMAVLTVREGRQMSMNVLETSSIPIAPDESSHGTRGLRSGAGISFVLVVCAVLTVATLKFFYYPLDKSLWLSALLLDAVAWLVACVVAVVAVVLVPQGRSRVRWVMTLLAVFGFASVILVDLDLGYPYVYFKEHRSEFAAAAAFADSIPVDEDGFGGAWLPRGQRDLAGGWIDVGPSSNGSRTAVLWMEMSSGVGYGYAYAPSATSGNVVTPRSWRTDPATALGDGWWWVSTL